MTLSNPLHRVIAGAVVPMLGTVFLLACQERLAAPADCPNLCPGKYEIRDTVIDPLQDQDSSFEGYLIPGQGSSLRTSYQFPVSEDRTVFRFVARPDSYTVKLDSLVPYTIDSVSLSVSVVYRDTSVKHFRVFLYRMPATVDSGVTFQDAEAAFTPANFIDSLLVDDTTTAIRLETILKDTTLGRVAIAPADSGKLAIGVQIRADQGTGARIGSTGTLAPSFITYVRIPSGDTTLPGTPLTRGISFQTFVSQTLPVADPSLLAIGGAPSARSLIRFPWSPFMRDSARLVRVSLELVPTAPFTGLKGDTAFVQARPLLADFGGKSPASPDPFFAATAPLALGQSDTVRLEVRRAATLWQAEQPTPAAFMLNLIPEVSNFTRATFGSTRTPGFAPRLRVTYALKFPFEAP